MRWPRRGRGNLLGAGERILALARRVVRTGGSRAGGELAVARAAGLSDAEIIEVLAHVANRAFASSVAILAQTERSISRGLPASRSRDG